MSVAGRVIFFGYKDIMYAYAMLQTCDPLSRLDYRVGISTCYLLTTLFTM